MRNDNQVRENHEDGRMEAVSWFSLQSYCTRNLTKQASREKGARKPKKKKRIFKRKGGLQAVYEDGAEKGKKEKNDSNFLNQDHTTFWNLT